MSLTLDSPSTNPPDLYPSFGAEVCAWIEGILVHGAGDKYGQPFRLRPDQRLALYRWYEYETDADGSFVRWHYDEMFLEYPKGGGKTELGAALALAELCGPLAPETPDIPVAAASFEQADLLFGRAKQIVEHKNCALRPFLECFDTEILIKGSPGRMFRIAAIAGTNDGGLPTLFLADEIHEWVGRKERLHMIVTNSLRKRRGGRVINMSTPGHDLNTLAGRIHNLGVSGNDPRLLHIWYTADESWDLTDPEQRDKAIRQANPWADDEIVSGLMRQYEKVPEHEFRRYHLAEWCAVPEDGWLADKPGAWEACKGNATFEKGAPTVIGIDLSSYRDTTAIAAVQRRSDGRIPVHVKVFEPNPNGGIPHEEVRQYIKTLWRDTGARAVVFDPYMMKLIADQLEDDGLPMIKMPQSVERMSPACAHLYDLILDQTIVHDGDPVLAAHVGAAARKENERGWRLSKQKSGANPIDACIAMVVAVDELTTAEEVEEESEVFFLN